MAPHRGDALLRNATGRSGRASAAHQGGGRRVLGQSAPAALPRATDASSRRNLSLWMTQIRSRAGAPPTVLGRRPQRRSSGAALSKEDGQTRVWTGGDHESESVPNPAYGPSPTVVGVSPGGQSARPGEPYCSRRGPGRGSGPAALQLAGCGGKAGARTHEKQRASRSRPRAWGTPGAVMVQAQGGMKGAAAPPHSSPPCRNGPPLAPGAVNAAAWRAAGAQP